MEGSYAQVRMMRNLRSCRLVRSGVQILPLAFSKKEVMGNDMKRRTLLKGILGGFGLFYMDSFFNLKEFNKKEGFYGINLTRRGSNGRIVDPRIFEILDYMNINDVSVHLPLLQETIHSNGIISEFDKVIPRDSDVLDLLEKLKLKNKKITMKPAIYLLDENGWKGSIEPMNLDNWFKNYEEIIMNYLDLIKGFNIGSFCVGTELNSMQKYDKNWRDLIKNVRKKFNGKITYCANWDAYKDVEFFSDLDYISLSAYFPLVEKGEEPSLEKLINSWRLIGKDLRDLSKIFNKDVVFGEIGYKSAEGSATQNYVDLEKVDYEEQRLCYKSLDYVLKNNIISVKKAYLWVNDTNDLKYPYDTRFEIFGKPVEQDLIIYSRE